MQYEQLFNAVFAAVNGAAGLPAKYFPNVSATVPTANHIRVDILPAPTASIGLSGVDWSKGVLQVMVCVKEGAGSVAAAKIADTVLALFPRGYRFSNGARIDKAGSVAPPLTGDGWFKLPVSFEYNHL